MTCTTLLASHDVQRHRTSKRELDETRAVIERDLGDARVAGLSADRRFATAYNAKLDLSTAGNTVTLKGPIELNDFKAFDAAGQQVVSEPKIAMAVDVSADTVAHNAKISSLRVDTPNSGAVQLIVTGGVTDWETKRQMDNIVVHFNGEWDKLWPIIKPLIPADTRAQVNDLVLTGKFERVINVSGSLPANVPFNEAVKSLSADGSVVIATAKWPSNGVDASNLEIPFTLKDGVLRTVYNKPEGQNLPSPLTLNTGEVNISNLSIDLTQKDPRLTTPKDYVLANKIALNNVLAAKAGKYIPLFSEAKSASGLVSVTIKECTKLPLSSLMTHAGASNDGTATIVYNVQQVQISNPTIDVILAAINEKDFGNSLRGDIRDARVTIANGEVTQDTTLSLGENAGRAIRFAGGVNMESLKLNDFIVNLPSSLLKQFSKDLEKYLPAGVDVGLKGLVTSPKLDLGNSVNKMFGDAAKKAAMDNLLGGNKKKADPNAPAASQPTDKKGDDPIGNIFDQLNKKKDKKKKN